MATSYTVQIDGKGVTQAAAITAFEDFIAALRLVTDAPEAGGEDPVGHLLHNDDFEEQASEVA